MAGNCELLPEVCAKHVYTVVQPLTHLLANDVQWVWSQDCVQACKEVKRLLASSEVLVHYNPCKPEVFCLLRGVRVIVPERHCEEVLTELHKNHPGMVRMKALARLHVWWPNLDTDIEIKVAKCETCKKQLPNLPKAQANPWSWPTSTMEADPCRLCWTFHERNAPGCCRFTLQVARCGKFRLSNSVLSKRNAFKISTKLHEICRAEAFCRASNLILVSNHTANDCKNDFLCLKHYVFVYIVDSDLCQREYFSKLSNTRTPVILLFSRVYTELRSRVSCRSSRTGTNWVLSGHNHRPIKPRARGVSRQQL